MHLKKSNENINGDLLNKQDKLKIKLNSIEYKEQGVPKSEIKIKKDENMKGGEEMFGIIS